MALSRTGRTALLSVISEEEEEKEKVKVTVTVTVKRLAFVGALDGEARGKVACLFFFFHCC